MATLWLREYEILAGMRGFIGGGGPFTGIQIASEVAVVDQAPVTFSASAQSAAFGANTNFIAIYGSAAFHYSVGSNPTATTNHLKVPADTLLYIGVSPGQKIAVIAAA